MRHGLAATAFVALLAIASAFGADLDANEKKWLAQCIDNLVGKSDRCRASAERAISGLGLDALPAILAASGKLKTDADWQALGRAVAAMGPDAAKTLDGLRMSWPKGTEKRMADLLEFLQKSEEDAKKNNTSVPLPKSPGDVAAAVAQLLDGASGRNALTPDDPEVPKIVAMGHAAVGALLKYLDEHGRAADDHAGVYYAQCALAELAEAGDVPAIASLVRKGKTAAALALKNFDDPQAVDAITDAIDRLFVDGDLVHAIERRGKSPKIAKALVAWLHKKAAVDKQYEVGGIAELFAKWRDSAAVDALLPLLDVLDQLQPKQRVALALTDLGEKSGIPALIDVLTYTESAPGVHGFDYPRDVAGLALNKIAGKEIYTSKQVAVEHGPPRFESDFAGASKAFREWWSKSRDRLAFDPGTRTWSVK